ncbi:MAG: F0F1 ATP synthase subunit epsilon [Pseudomonadota bacterium]
MADKLHFSLVSPERELLSVEADQVDIPGSEGWLGILPNHAPFMTTLAPGVVRVVMGSEEKRVFVRGGFAEISPAGLTVLAEEAVPTDELKGDKIAARIKDAEEDVADAETDEKKQAAQQNLDRLLELQAAI